MTAIQEIQYIVSLFCPGRCVNCGIWKYDKKEITANELELNEVELLAQSKALKGINYIQLTGGEVQLSPKYVPVVKTLSEAFPHAIFHTNISGWYPETHRRILDECLQYVSPDRFRIDISLDGRPETYSKVRLVKEGWNKAVKTAALLKEVTSNLRFVFTIYKGTFQDMEWFIGFARQMNIGYYFEFAREATFLNNSGAISDSMAFNQEELDSIEGVLKSSGFIERKDRQLKWKRAKSVYRGSPMPFDCHAGSESLLIDPYGNVFPCLEMREFLKMGNLRDFRGSLDQLLSAPEASHILDRIRQKECQPCTMLCVHRVDESADAKELSL